MAKFLIRGGKKLSGSIAVGGFKNSVLPILAATLLTDKTCVLTNVPGILDVDNFVRILEKLGAKVKYRGHRIEINCGQVKGYTPDRDLVSSMRASVVLMGALLGRCNRVALAYPGGDLIGARPVNVHMRAFESLGAKVSPGPVLKIVAKQLSGNSVYAESSVTGTENAILAAVRAKGRTVIKLAAQEPHVGALCEFLRKMGARISGIGTHTIIIDGVKKLGGAKFEIIPDMIEAGSFAILGAASRSELEIRNVNHEHMDAVYNKLTEMGVRFEKGPNTLFLLPPKNDYKAAVIRTGYYPNLATDLQPPFGILTTQAKGRSIIHDWIYEGRLGYLGELRKMGAAVTIKDSHTAEVLGPTPLHGNIINSLDIRSGMTLVIAALVAKGQSVLSNIHHIDRGYANLEERLQKLGADIKRID